ncbi:hypothetical protein BGZ79_000858 [Entomortierella chlamydospora]|nr:hypothetical protein BGZ79_000858 [Entomortierella chlamydospora]
MNHHPLHILEIIELISDFLTPRDRVNCLRVSKIFHAAIISDVWHTIDLGRRRHTGKVLSFPVGEALEHNKSHIRVIRFRGVYPSEYLPLIGCQSIRELVLDATADVYGPDILERVLVGFTTLIELSSATLQNLSIRSDSGQLEPGNNLWNALIQCSSLSYINFSGFKVPDENILQFIQICGKALSISLSYMMISRLPPLRSVSDGASNDERISRNFNILARPRELRMWGSFGTGIGLSPVEQAAMFRMCPNLESLTWRSAGDGASSLWLVLGHESPMSDHARNFCATLSKDPWPLTALQSLDLSFCMMKDEDHATLISRVHRLKSYKAVCSQFGPLSLDALIGEGGQPSQRQQHRNTIETLFIDRCPSVTGNMILRILESCPNMKKLAADRITISEIAQGQSWICSGLESLEVYLAADDINRDEAGGNDNSINNESNIAQDISSEEFQRMQRTVYIRLNSLTRLRKLALTNRTSQPCSEKRTLDLRLQAGLGLLSNLRNLMELSFRLGVAQKMSVEEAHWITENWPKLKCMQGVWNEDESVYEEMKDIIKPEQMYFSSRD